jgi:hypothetical protein
MWYHYTTMRQGITYVGTLTPEEVAQYEVLNQESLLEGQHHSDELRDRRLEFHLSVIARMKKEPEYREPCPHSEQDVDDLRRRLTEAYGSDIVL